jgi:hypothetical protein
VGQSFLCSFFSQVAVVATADAPFEQKNLCRTFTGASATFRVPILGLDMSLMKVDTLAEAVGFPILRLDFLSFGWISYPLFSALSRIA